MESTGERDRIQCSQSTADLLRFSGKARWVHPRKTLVNAKGKGQLQTYWIEIVSNGSAHHSSRRSSNSSEDSKLSGTSVEDAPPGKSMLWGVQEDMKKDDDEDQTMRHRSKHQRLIDYNVDLLSQHLKMVIARRQMLRLAGRRCSQGGLPPQVHSFSTETPDDGRTVLGFMDGHVEFFDVWWLPTNSKPSLNADGAHIDRDGYY